MLFLVVIIRFKWEVAYFNMRNSAFKLKIISYKYMDLNKLLKFDFFNLFCNKFIVNVHLFEIKASYKM